MSCTNGVAFVPLWDTAQWSERWKLIIFQFWILCPQGKLWKIFGGYKVKTVKNYTSKCLILSLSSGCFSLF